MRAPGDVAKRHLGRTSPPREPMAGWRGVSCRTTPTGWPMDDAKALRAVETEALTEAGAAGFISSLPFGDCFLDRRLDRCAWVQCRTMVCATAAGGPLRRSKGRVGRTCRRNSFWKAARLADEREISRLLTTRQGTRSD